MNALNSILIVKSNKGNEKLFVDGYGYHFRSKTVRCFGWVCSKAKLLNCKARILTQRLDNGEHIIKKKPKDHTHTPDTHEQILAQTNEMLKYQALNSDRPAEEIVRDIIALVPSTSLAYLPSKDALLGKIKRTREKKVKIENKETFDDQITPMFSEELWFMEGSNNISLNDQAIWNEELIKTLINEYKLNEFLWKKSDLNFNNEEIRMKKYKEIAAILGPTFTYKNVMNKISQLQKNYFEEKLKILERSENTWIGNSYQPKEFWYPLLTFLNDENYEELNDKESEDEYLMDNSSVTLELNPLGKNFQNNETNDPTDIYGKYIASELKQLQSYSINKFFISDVRREINKVISNAWEKVKEESNEHFNIPRSNSNPIKRSSNFNEPSHSATFNKKFRNNQNMDIIEVRHVPADGFDLHLECNNED